MEATAKKRYGGVSVSATYLVIIILCVFCGSSASARVDDALSRIDRQRELYPQERLHAVTDRDMYCAGDTVWLRVFVTDAATGYQRYKEYVSPLLSSEAVEDELDMNSTLLWLPSVKFDKNGKDLTLSMPVTKDYTIEIEGLTDNDIIHNIVRQPL